MTRRGELRELCTSEPGARHGGKAVDKEQVCHGEKQGAAEEKEHGEDDRQSNSDRARKP
jgi:hypothetical protein